MAITFTAKPTRQIFPLQSYSNTACDTDKIISDDYYVYAFSSSEPILSNASKTLCGNIGKLEIGELYDVTADLIDTKYGKQYKVAGICRKPPLTAKSQINYLTKSKTMTANQAITLLTVYPDIVEILAHNWDFQPDYSLIKGVSQATFERIRQRIIENYGILELYKILEPHDLKYSKFINFINQSSVKTEQFSGNNSHVIFTAKAIIERDPWVLHHYGMSFDTVDNFAVRFKPEMKNSKQRTNAFIEHLLKQNRQNGLDCEDGSGHTCADLELFSEILKNTAPDCCADNYDDIIAELTSGNFNDANFVVYNNKIGFRSDFENEKFVYKTLCRIQNHPNSTQHLDYKDAIANTNYNMRQKFGSDAGLTSIQQDAVVSACENNVTLITGYAGTGKTEIIKTIADIFESEFGKTNIALIAPTGKAARRITESTGYTAKTIHRLLEYNSVSGFAKNEDDPLNQRIVIIDEASMVDSALFCSLLKAASKYSKFVIIFDPAQLAPVGSGSVAADLLQSELPIFCLDTIHRQAANSGIIIDSEHIRNGCFSIHGYHHHAHGELCDMEYAFYDAQEDILGAAIHCYMSYFSTGYSDINDLTLLTPTRAYGTICTDRINEKLQDLILPNESVGFKSGNQVIKLGAKVINTKNNYSLDVVNGEVGIVTSVLQNGNICTVDFGNDKVVGFDKENANHLQLAYAINIHRSQGSQYKCVIIALDNVSHFRMLNRNMLYTAVTRAQEKCVCISTPTAYNLAIERRDNKRQTFLQEIIATPP